MALSPGTRIGSYEVVGPLGAGGMGEVYRARDARLGRDAAIKILPEVFLNDADRVARFEREARTLASLNHPNIAGIYGIEGSAIVMELVEGEDLSELLARGPVPLADALKTARQIASALEAAHEQGIVHRDLKPANVKVRPDGTVKVLDFGLARPGGSGDASGSIANSPTMTSPATAFGMIIGTAAYMSPEQARGKAVDRRADVWAFGVVLYEMLSGRRAYPGSEVSDVLASVLKDTLPLDGVPADTPAAIRRLLRRCLEKDRADRLDSMATARLEIADAMAPSSDDAPAVTAAVAPNRSRTMLIAAVAVIAASALTGFVVWRARTPEPLQPISFALAPPLGEMVQVNVNQPALAISNDGRRIVYGIGVVGKTLVVRSLDQFADLPLTNLGTQPRSPFFSPDDKWLGYFAAASSGEAARLMKVAPTGGAPLEIATVQGNLRGASWGRDNTIVFASTAWESGLLRVSADGGDPEVLTKPDTAAGEVDHQWPSVMPDGRHVVFTVSRVSTQGALELQRDIAVLDLATRNVRVIRQGASYPRLVGTSHLLFVTDRGVFAAPFDPVACEFRGEAVRVIEDVAVKPSSGGADVEVSNAGVLTYIAGGSVTVKSLAWIDQHGVETPMSAPERGYGEFKLSPDATRAVVTTNDDGASSLHVYDLTRGTLSRITPPTERGFAPVWSSDGRFVYYRSYYGDADSGLSRISAAGGGSPELLLAEKDNIALTPTGATPDGRSLLLRTNAGGRFEIQILNLEGTPSPTRLVADPDGAEDGQVSPDGRWLAYRVRVGSSGAGQVFLRPFPNVTDSRVQVSIDGGSRPVWAANSRAVFYSGTRESGGIWRVDLAANGQLGKPMLVLAASGDAGQVIDIATGGDRFIRIQPVVDKTKTNELRVMLNWFELLKQKMAGGK
ncbi:MAG: serine/threonine-protein kinase [Acidobacteria bacterium]|nr:serine/threonine-protein kinase [Acidobacteriota bacterium]